MNIFPVSLSPLFNPILSLKILRSDVLPAPVDPMMYSAYPGRAYPDAPLTICCLIVDTPLSLASFLFSLTVTSYSKFSKLSLTALGLSYAAAFDTY